MVNHESNAAASSAAAATTGKKTEGRRKVEMKKLEKKIKQQVTFSKRRSGLFKKASELCLLCGAEIAIITFSPAKRVFCYGHRDLDTILNCYLAGKPLPEAKENLFPVHSLNKEYEDSQLKLEREKQKQKQKAATIEVVPKKAWYEDGGFWWEKSVDNLGLEELEEYMVSMQELRKKVALKADHMMMMRTDYILSNSKSINGTVNQFDNQDGDGGAAASVNHNSFN